MATASPTVTLDGDEYHRALADTGSASRKCALRYPVYLMDRNLPGLLGRAS
jgi:hypothetical protein